LGIVITQQNDYNKNKKEKCKMRKNEIKKTETIEKVVRVEYIAEDGTIFYNEEECKKYEESALFAVSNKLKRLSKLSTSIYDLVEEGCDESSLEIFDVQTEDDLENLRRYLYLTMTQNGASEDNIKSCFTSVDGKREKFVFDNVTIGHEVMIFWGDDEDWFWVCNDGSLEGYFDWIKSNYFKIITPKEDNN
jgi:hypothetical protein